MKPIQNFITKSSLIVGSFSLLAVTAHLFFRMIEHAPYVSTDDGLANVAVALSETGRYAFLTSPINFGLLRDETFFNFGPIYFYAGSLLTWLFDSPLVMMRALHPASLAVVTVLAFYVFGPTSRAAVLLLAIALFQLFWSVQWPMVRPDIFVSLLAFGSLAAVSKAIHTDKPLWWLVGAFLAASAATQHLIAWSIVPWFIFLWLGWCVAPAPNRWQAAKSIWWPLMGGVIGFLVFFQLFDWQVERLYAYVTSYKSMLSGFPASDRVFDYPSIFERHLISGFWDGLNRLYKIFLVGGVAMGLVTLALVRRQPRFKLMSFLFLPALLLFAFYALSLGLYPNFHSGYILLLQVSSAWAAAAGVAVFLATASARYSRFLQIEIAAVPTLAVVALWSSQTALTSPPHWSLAGRNNVNFTAYSNRVFETMPVSARVLGPMRFGIESGKRVQLIQQFDLKHLLQYIAEDQYPALAPEWLVLQGDVKSQYTWSTFNNDYNVFYDMTKLFGVKYVVSAIIDGFPYGSTYVYRAQDKNDSHRRSPSFSIAIGQQWVDEFDFSEPLAVTFREAEPVRISTPIANITVTAVHTLKLESPLATGTYVIDLALDGQNPDDRPGALSAFNSANPIISLFNDLGFQFDERPVFANEDRISMVLHYDGGPLYLALTKQTPGARMSVISLRRVEPRATAYVLHPLPPVRKWQAATDAVATHISDDGRMRFDGDNSPWNYQVISPPFSLPQGQNFELEVPVETDTGRLAIGLLNKNGRWLSTPVSVGKPIRFNTVSGENIQIVLINDQNTGVPIATSATIGLGSLKAFPQSFEYVSAFSACAHLYFEGKLPDGTNIKCKVQKNTPLTIKGTGNE